MWKQRNTEKTTTKTLCIRNIEQTLDFKKRRESNQHNPSQSQENNAERPTENTSD